jgi:hypothetical protein
VLKPYMAVDMEMHKFFVNRLQDRINQFGLSKMDAYLTQLAELKAYVSEKCEIAEHKGGIVMKTKEK